MSTISDSSGSSSAKHLYKLTCKVTGKEGDDVTSYFKFALRMAQSTLTIPSYTEINEQEIVEDIKCCLTKDKRDKDAIRFSHLHRRLQLSTILKNRWAILHFLYCLKDSNSSSVNYKLNTLAKGLLDVSLKTTRLPISGNERGKKSESDNNNEQLKNGKCFEGTWPNPHNIPGVEHNYEALRSFWQGGQQANFHNKSSVKVTGGHRASREYTESVILREMLYAFQGINGQIIKFDCAKEEVWIEPKAGLSDSVRQQMLKLAELGWLFNKVNKYYVSASSRRCGLVEQSFAAALHNELTEYYRILAELESQLQQDDEQGISSGSNGLTLMSLRYWAVDPIRRFTLLASLIDTCKGLKGGALASAIYSYLILGDPVIRSVVKKIWTVVSVPIYRILRKWIVDGELDDSFQEFFVVVEPGIHKEQLWDEKYRLNESMVPSFITVDQAYKILSTGKSINFLRHVCLDKTPLHERSAISKIIANNCAESVFTQDRDGDLQKIIDVTYKETSSHLLNVMHSTYKFMDHLKAMRRYLLLGQGDFIRHLMDLLEPHLNGSANNLYMQNLSGILDNAIRSTNAQFDDVEILKRLDNRLMEVSSGDCGWDIYTLDYKINGPIGAVFTPKVMKLYLQLFHYLWKAKRMEYSLSELWRSQMAVSKSLKQIPELCPILHQCHILTSEMVHFIQQMQYYITFEVMECSWDVLETKVKAAEDFDKVISAHEEFLEAIITRALLDDNSEDLRMQLQTIYSLIIQFKTIQDQFFGVATEELKLRHSTMISIKNCLDEKVYEEKVQSEKMRQAEFVSKVVLPTRTQLRILSVSYQDMVKKFLLMLTSHRDVNLQFLSFRLDFNSHYKNQDSRLHTSLTFQIRRKSSKQILLTY